jgi:xylulokinase
MALATERPLVDPEQRTMTFAHFRRGLYLPCGTMQAGGASLKWFKDTLCGLEETAVQGSAMDAYDLLNQKAAGVAPGSGGLLYLPYLIGERSPYWNPKARGAFIGLSMIHDKSHMIRAVLEGVAFNMKLIYEAFSEQGVQSDLIRMIGGGARSRIWRKIFADVLQKPTARLNFIEEATSIGAAIAGGVGVGLFDSLRNATRFIKTEETVEPDEANRPIYSKTYGLFKESYQALVRVFDALGREV